MSDPSPEKLDIVREAVRQVVWDDTIAKFRDGDLALLWRQRFETKEDLLAATSEQLALINLPAALIAHLKAGECVGFVSCAPRFTSMRTCDRQKAPLVSTRSSTSSVYMLSVVEIAGFSWLAVISGCCSSALARDQPVLCKCPTGSEQAAPP